MPDYRKGSQTAYAIQYHLVWVTKYLFQALREEIAERACEIIRQIGTSRELTISKRPVNTDQIHLMVSSPPTLSPSQIVHYGKGISSYTQQNKFPRSKNASGDNLCGHALTFAAQLG